MTDTPIYDQLRAELSSHREVAQEAAPRQRSRAAEKSAPSPRRAADTTTEAGQPVSVWTLVNANRRSKRA